MNRPSYGSAVFRPMSGPIAISGPRAVVLRFDAPVTGVPVRELAPAVDGLFDEIGHAVSHVVSDAGKAISHAASDVGRAVGHAASDVGHAVDHAVKDAGRVVNDSARWVGHAIAHPDQAINEAATWVVHAVRDVTDWTGHNLVTIVQLVQLGVSFIPGIGQGLSAVIGGALALAEGKSISDALIAAALGALPGGPAVQMAASLAMEAVTGVIEHKNLADIVGNVVADNIPGGGEIAKTVIHGAASVVSAATSGKDVGQALLSGATSAAGSVLGGQIPLASAVSGAVGGMAGKVVAGVTSAVGKTVVDAAGRVVVDVASGKRLDQAVAGAAAGALTDVARERLVPGGLAATATNAAGQVLSNVAQGKRLDQAVTGVVGGLAQGYVSRVPGAGLAGAAAASVAQLGKPLDLIALNVTRANLAGGEAARQAFDIALALKHAQNVQRAGIAHPETLLPLGDAKAEKFFHATRVVVGVGLKARPGTTFQQLHEAQLKALQAHIRAGAPAVARPLHPAGARPRHPSARAATTSPAARGPMSPLPPKASLRPSYARAVLHPAGAPPLDGLLDDLVHQGAGAVVNVVQTATGAASALPAGAGGIARAVADAAAKAIRPASSPTPAPRTTPSAAAPAPSSTAIRRQQMPPTTSAAGASAAPASSSNVAATVALGAAALAAVGGVAWWTQAQRPKGGRR